jgi:hypothetical protein
MAGAARSHGTLDFCLRKLKVVENRRVHKCALFLRLFCVNEFYQKGCQEKKSVSTGVEVLFLETQPTFHRLRCRGFAF